MKWLCITNKVHRELRNLAEESNICMEALGNILLILSLCNEDTVKQAIRFIKQWDLGGASRLENENKL